MPSDPGERDQNYFSILSDNKSKRKYNVDNSHDFPNLGTSKKTKPNSCPKFILIKNVVEDKPIKSFNIFAVSKAIESITLEQTLQTTFTREGHLLILAKNESQANKFLKATKFSNLCDIKVQYHPTLNICKGVIYAEDLANLSEDEIVEGLKSQHVTDCKKIKKMKEGKLVNTPLHIISFNRYDIPSKIEVACQTEAKCFVCSSADHKHSLAKTSSLSIVNNNTVRIIYCPISRRNSCR